MIFDAGGGEGGEGGLFFCACGAVFADSFVKAYHAFLDEVFVVGTDDEIGAYGFFDEVFVAGKQSILGAGVAGGGQGCQMLILEGFVAHGYDYLSMAQVRRMIWMG